MEKFGNEPNNTEINPENKETLEIKTEVLSSEDLIERVYEGESLPRDERFLPTDKGGVFKYFYLDEVISHIGRENKVYPVVEVGGVIVAISELEKDPKNKNNLWIKSISVDPKYEGSGYASKLLEKIFEHAQENGYSLQTSRYSDEGIIKLRQKIHKLSENMSVPLIDEYATQEPEGRKYTPKKEQMSTWADELDALQEKAMANLRRSGEKIEYVNWIVQDLRSGNFEKAKANYNNQSDKFGQWKEIDEFLTRIGVAEKIDWSKWHEKEE